MTLSEAVSTVVSLTKRPEKGAEALRQINRAIAFFTLKANFCFDLVEDTLDIDATLYGQTVALTGLTRFRKFKYIRPTSRRYFLKAIDPVQVFNPNGSANLNRFFVSGTSLTITQSELDASLEIGYYSYAPTLDLTTNTTHWMLDRMPDALVERASAMIFRSIGDDASAKQFIDSSNELFITARADFEDGVVPEAN